VDHARNSRRERDAVQVGSVVASTARWPFGVRQGGRLRKALAGQEQSGQEGDRIELWKGEGGGETSVESRIQYSMHRRAVRVVAGTSRPDNSNPEILVERFLRHPRGHRRRKRVGTSRSSEVYLARNEGTASHLVRRLGTVPEHRPCGTSLGILEGSTSPGRPSVKTLSRSLAESGSNKWSSRGEIARLFIVDLGPPFLTRDILGGRRRRSRRGEGGRSED